MDEVLVADIVEKCTAIVKFGPAGFSTDGMKLAEYYQVTIDPEKISPSGNFIRFGTTQGDELVGWQRAAALTVVEVLALWANVTEFDEHGLPLLLYGTSGKITMMVTPP